MVAAPHVARCDTCRKRKVKCDEKWPICTPCRKGGRDCPGPPDRYKFMKSRKNYEKGKPDSCSSRGSQSSSSTSPDWHVDESSVSSDGSLLQLSCTDASRDPVRLEIMGASDSRGGSRGLDFVTFSMPALMSMSTSDRLACELVDSLSTGPIDISSKTFCFSHLFYELPKYLGLSPALDAATECMNTSLKGCLTGDSAHYSKIISQKYGKALSLLRKAINDPIERHSDYTLAAIMVIWRNEGFFMDNPHSLWTSGHMQAIYDLIRIRGHGNLDNAFSFFLMLDCQTGVIGHALYTGQECFLEDPEWQTALSPRHGRSEISMLYYNVHRETTKWSSLLKSIAKIRDGPIPGASHDLPHVLGQAIQISQTLRFIDSRIEDMLIEKASTRPSETGDELVPMVYHFKDPALAGLIAWHTTYAVSINRAVQYLFTLSAQSSTRSSATLQSVNDPNENEMIFDLYQQRNLNLCRRSWMCYEQVRQWKPLGCHFLLSPLRASVRYADTPEMKAWIDRASRDVAAYLPWRSPFNQDMIEHWCRKVCGEDVF